MGTVTTEQVTLAGDTYIVDESTNAPKNGVAAVLYHAPKDADLDQIADWYQRLDAEGLV